MTTAKTKDQRGWIQAVEKTFHMLQYMKHHGPVGVTELSTEHGFSKSSVHNYLNTLESMDYVQRDGQKYDLSPKLFSLGGRARDTDPVIGRLYREGKPIVDELARDIGENVRLMSPVGDTAIIIYISSGPNAVGSNVYSGIEIPMHATSLGKAFLAHLPEADRLERVARMEFEACTRASVTDREELLTELDDIRERGYAFDDEERAEGLRCVGVPLHPDGEVIGAMSISGPPTRFEGDYYTQELPEKLQRAAKVIELNIAHD